MVTAKSCVAALLAILAGVGIAGASFAATLTVTRTGSGSGTVTSNVGAINCGATCSDTYADSTLITLTAAPTAGNQFTGWLGPCTGAGTCQFTINGATTAVATFAPTSLGTPSLNIDGNTSYDALTDGLLVIRHLFGLTGTSLINGAVGPGATRTSATQIGNYLTDINPTLDIDGNGQTDALTDGLLVVRYLFGLRGASLIAGAVGPGALRTTAAALETQIQGAMPAFPTFTLTVTKNGNGTVTSSPPGINCGADCTENYTSGTVVTLTATPGPGSTFSGWSTSCASTTVVTMNAAKSITANFTPSSSSASGWTQATRICPVADGDDSLGAFALPNGQLAAASAKGLSVQYAGQTFPAPTPFPAAFPVALTGPFHVQSVFHPDSSGIVAWPTSSSVSIQDRAADGTYTGTRQNIIAGVFNMAQDGAGNVSLAYGTRQSTDQVRVITRAAGATSFTDTTGQIVANAPSAQLRALVVDPSGAAVVVWTENDAVKQAVRPAGGTSFGAPITIQATNVATPWTYAGPTVGSNAAGRAVLAFYDTVTLQYRAAIREPGGAFGAPVDLGPGRIIVFQGRISVAVAQDGNAAVAADSLGPETGCPGGTVWPQAVFSSISIYRVAAGATSWTPSGSIGGAFGGSALWATLTGGAGSRIEAAWWEDPATLLMLCDGLERTQHLVAGTLGASMTTVYDYALLPKGQPVTYGRIPFVPSVMDSMALNACGDGVLVFSLNLVNNFNEPPATAVGDGIFVASTKGCP
ncbi:MAG: hypothetical protein ABI831_09810 [Betaproteobacteria bacterium]